MKRGYFRDLWSALVSFSERERRRILLLLPLLVVLGLLFVWKETPRVDPAFLRYTDRVVDSLREQRTEWGDRRAEQTWGGRVQEEGGGVQQPVSLFRFDPNTIDRAGLLSLGFSPKQSQAILNYRAAGARFRQPEDFARCYTVSPQKFAELKSYIEITTEVPNPSLPSGALSLESSLQGASPSGQEGRGASVEQGIEKVEEREPSTPPKSDRAGGEREVLIDLNRADSVTLVQVRGIGPLTAGQIIRYRERLGGYASVEQLQEVEGMLEKNYLRILGQIFVDCSEIQKIDVNFASPKELMGHPYLSKRVVNKLLKNRQLKGGWSTTRELIEEHILSEEEATRLDPYLYFREE